MIDRFDKFTTAITTIYKNLQRIKNREMEDFCLKGSHTMFLFYLQQNPEGLTAARLCELCGEDKAAVSRNLSYLVEQGFVAPAEQTGGKNYRTRMILTEKGIATALRLNDSISEAVDFAGNSLTEEERETFYRALLEIAENLASYRTDIQ